MARQHSATFKFEVVRQLQTREKRLAQLCREHDLDPAMVRDWKAQVERHGTQAFPRSLGGEAAADPHAGRSLATAETRIGELERLVGQLALENEFLKKALKQAHSRIAKDTR